MVKVQLVYYSIGFRCSQQLGNTLSHCKCFQFAIDCKTALNVDDDMDEGSSCNINCIPMLKVNVKQMKLKTLENLCCHLNIIKLCLPLRLKMLPIYSSNCASHVFHRSKPIQLFTIKPPNAIDWFKILFKYNRNNLL